MDNGYSEGDLMAAWRELVNACAEGGRGCTAAEVARAATGFSEEEAGGYLEYLRMEGRVVREGDVYAPAPRYFYASEVRGAVYCGDGKYGRPGIDDDGPEKPAPLDVPTLRPPREDPAKEAVYERLVVVWRREKRHCIFEEDFDANVLREYSWGDRSRALATLINEGSAVADHVFCGPWRAGIRKETEEYIPEAIVAFVIKQKRTNEVEMWCNLKIARPVFDAALKRLYGERFPRIVDDDGVIRPARVGI